MKLRYILISTYLLGLVSGVGIVQLDQGFILLAMIIGGGMLIGTLVVGMWIQSSTIQSVANAITRSQESNDRWDIKQADILFKLFQQASSNVPQLPQGDTIDSTAIEITEIHDEGKIEW